MQRWTLAISLAAVAAAETPTDFLEAIRQRSNFIMGQPTTLRTRMQGHMDLFRHRARAVMNGRTT